MEQTTLLELYTRLVKLREHLPEGGYVAERYIEEYNNLLFALSDKSGINLDGFSILESDLHEKEGEPYVTKIGTMAKHPSTQVCERPFYLMKLDAVLLFFEMQTNNTKSRPIGFSPPSE